MAVGVVAETDNGRSIQAWGSTNKGHHHPTFPPNLPSFWVVLRPSSDSVVLFIVHLYSPVHLQSPQSPPSPQSVYWEVAEKTSGCTPLHFQRSSRGSLLPYKDGVFGDTHNSSLVLLHLIIQLYIAWSSVIVLLFHLYHFTEDSSLRV